ncbi:MAG: Surface layer protein precursor [Firmicutes bacterium ADurb.Bin193]|nr:MAG: Surface layer protein precursor [Firmicutes bacterium ADurb.Bin193]
MKKAPTFRHCIVLIFVFVVSINILTYHAAASGYINRLTDMGIIFDNSSAKQITRAEMVKVIVQFMGIEAPTDNYNLSNFYVFKDVTWEHWAAPYIAIARSYGIVQGDGNKYFYPDNYVTYGEAIKIIVASLGYLPLAEKQGGYPEGYIKQGRLLGIVDDIPNYSEFADAENIKQMLFNALPCPILEQKSGTVFDCIICDGKNGRPLFTAEMRSYSQSFYLMDKDNYIVLHNEHFKSVSMEYDINYSAYYLSLTLNSNGKEKLSSATDNSMQDNEAYLKIIYNNEMISQIYMSSSNSDTYHIFLNLSKYQLQKLIENFKNT